MSVWTRDTSWHTASTTSSFAKFNPRARRARSICRPPAHRRPAAGHRTRPRRPVYPTVLHAYVHYVLQLAASAVDSDVCVRTGLLTNMYLWICHTMWAKGLIQRTAPPELLGDTARNPCDKFVSPCC
jgi:hypothetical protein